MAKAQEILQDIIRQTANAAGDYLRPDAPRTYAQGISDLREAVKQFKTEIGTWTQLFTQETNECNKWQKIKYSFPEKRLWQNH